MKKVINGFLTLIGFIGLVCLLAFVTDNSHLIKAVTNTYLLGRSGPSIDEHAIFDNRIVRKSTHPFSWKEKKPTVLNGLLPKEEAYHKSFNTAAFLVIKSDTILFEKYWGNYSDSSLTNSFSVAKSLIGLAVGAAIQDGYIKSVHQPIYEFLPEYNTEKGRLITIKHLLQMTSGIDFGESYGDPFGFMAKAYYGKNLHEITVENLPIRIAGGTWEYQGGNTLLLSFIIEKATGKKVAEYFSEKIWQPIGAENDALWNLDTKNGREKAYCCFYSNARDFAKVGKLYHQNGFFNHLNVLPESYILDSKRSVNLEDSEGNLVDYYGYQWWITEFEGETIHYARGILGQYIVILPEEDLIFVRLGKLRSEEKINHVPSDLIEYIKMAKRLK